MFTLSTKSNSENDLILELNNKWEFTCEKKNYPRYDEDATYYTFLLPYKNEKKYEEIEKFPDYDYLNSIAYEMLIRTNQFIKIEKLTLEEKKIAYTALGLNTDDFFEFKPKIPSVINNKPFFYVKNHLTISMIENGLEKLISHYKKKKKIFKLDHDETFSKINSFKKITTISIEEINSSLSDYYIPVDNILYKKHDNSKKYIALNDHEIFLYYLEEEFLQEIDQYIPNNISTPIELNYTRPLIKLKESAVFNIPLNFHWSKDEIINVIAQLKEEFDSKNIKTSYGYIYDKSFSSFQLSSHTPFRVTKKSISEAFYAYDLYKDIKNKHNTIKEKLHIELDEEIENIKRNNSNKDTIKYLTKECKIDYWSDIKEYNYNDLLQKIAVHNNITPYKLKKYLQFMKKYIDKGKYIDLLIGNLLNN